MLVSVFGFAYYAYAGKQAVKEGDGIHGFKLKWHEEIDANRQAKDLPDFKKGI